MNYTLTINDFIYHDDTSTCHTHNESMATLKYNLDNADCRQH